MQSLQLSPEERSRFDKCMSSVEKLVSAPFLSNTNAFILRHQMRAVLKMLGVVHPNRVLIRDALDIMESNSKEKLEQLIQLINGKRR